MAALQANEPGGQYGECCRPAGIAEMRRRTGAGMMVFDTNEKRTPMVTVQLNEWKLGSDDILKYF